jgi:thioredoxin 1
MIERGILLASFALLLVATYVVWRYMMQQQTRRLALAEIPPELGRLALKSGPVVLYFTTATCAQCRFQQTPALAQVQRQLDALQVLKLDAVEHHSLADFYHVMTVPTTVVLDERRHPVAINHGLASADRLLAQVGRVL